MKLFEMFSGYGGASLALEMAGIEYECVGISEINKNALKCYNPTINYGDCTKIDYDALPDFDLLTGGFPCQPFTQSGLGLGCKDDRGTLFDSLLKAIETKRPKYCLLENVQGITFPKHKEYYKYIIESLEQYYTVHHDLLDSKHYGKPHSRKRVFFVCTNEPFEYPDKEPMPLLKDYLDYDIEEEPFNKYFIARNINTDYCGCITSSFLRKKLSNNHNESLYMGSKIYKLTGVKRGLSINEAKRLMSIDRDFSGISNSGIAQLIGNGWDVSLVSKIFKKMIQK